jgi:glycosyltransferase involved in cell wall biosynthesis
MRIAVASSGLGHVARGIEAWATDLAAALAERGEDVVLYKGGGTAQQPYERVLPCWQREQPRTQRLLALLPKRGLWRLGLGSRYDWEQTTFARSLIAALHREPADVLHVQDPTVALAVQRAHHQGLLPTRVILGHGTEEPVSFLARIDYLQQLAPWHLEDTRAAGVYRDCWTAIPNFIDVQTFHPGHEPDVRAQLGIPADAVVVLTAAAIKRPHKRIDAVIGEWARLRAQQPELPVWFIFAGGGEVDTDELVAEGHAALGDRVRFLVRHPRAQMAALYRAADLFALGSLKEMMPIALLEALASGLPCLVNDHPVMTWMVGPGGRTLDLEQPGSLAAAVADLAVNAAERERLGQAARDHCVAQFGQDAVVTQLLEYYERVVSWPEPVAPAQPVPTT